MEKDCPATPAWQMELYHRFLSTVRMDVVTGSIQTGRTVFQEKMDQQGRIMRVLAGKAPRAIVAVLYISNNKPYLLNQYVFESREDKAVKGDREARVRPATMPKEEVKAATVKTVRVCKMVVVMAATEKTEVEGEWAVEGAGAAAVVQGETAVRSLLSSL